MVDLNSLLPANSGWTLTQASAINNEGQIVGYGIHNGATHAFLLDLSEIAPSSLVWNTTGGGADLSYQISGSDLSEPTTIQLDWATGTTTDTIVGEPIDTITSGTTVGTYGPIHVDADTLGKAPEGAKYLLAVADPDHEVDQQEQVEMSAKY